MLGRARWVAVCGIFGSAALSIAQEARTENTLTRQADFKPQPATIGALDWLAGHWTGSSLGGTVDEIWSPAQGGEMIGMFRLVQNGKATFYEFMTISTADDNLTLRLKHFDSALKGWEAQDQFVEFKFVKQDGDRIYFDGLTFVRNSDDRMTVFVANEVEGKTRELRFDFSRAAATTTPER